MTQFDLWWREWSERREREMAELRRNMPVIASECPRSDSGVLGYVPPPPDASESLPEATEPPFTLWSNAHLRFWGLK